MEIPKIICPVCGGEVRDKGCLDKGIGYEDSWEHFIGTCKKCGETVEYDYIYPHKDCKIEITDHYKD